MSCAFVVTMMLLGSSAVIAFVLQPPKQESAASVISAVSHHRCQGESLQSVRKRLLRDLSLQTEPQLPSGALDGVRKQWKSAFRAAVEQSHDAAGTSASGHSSSSDDGNQLQCCSMNSEVFMTDLGWDTWVIHPDSLTLVQCAGCSSVGNAVQCPRSHTNTQDATQALCCQPTSQTTVPIVYMDELGTVVMSSVQMTQSCGCEPPPPQQ
ncbi:bone morphogenetic protein 7-like [Sphaeramia orbicularis]|uniref:bone morphogenetic protein 7-like n=1 Tax=Sphaeramia orbicularis TaxID=375764 RepID=UPI00117C79D1|nr:bone morphogenetic protein 7-like [Sphaeramia orbicularis]